MATISIAVVSDTKEAVSSVKNLSTEYSGLVDQLKQLGPDGQQAAEKLEQSMKAAQLATQGSAEAATKLVSSINEAKLTAAQGGLDLSKPMRETASASEDAAGGIRQVSEEGQSLSEGLKMNASFGAGMLATQLGSGEGGVAGAASSAAQALAGMGMMMGPEVALPAAALGGIVAWLASQIGNASAESQAFQASVGSDVDAMLKLGPTALQQADTVNKSLQSMADNTFKLSDGSSKSFEQIQADARSVGVSTTTMMQAYAGVPAAMDRVSAAASKKEAALAQADAAQRKSNTGVVEANTVAEQQEKHIEDITHGIDGNTKAAREANTAYEAYTKSQEKAADSLKRVTTAYDKAKSAASAFNSTMQSDLKSTGSELDQILDRSTKDADTIIDNQQKEIAANKRFLDDWNAAVKAGLDANGQAYVQSNRAAFQEVIDTYGINSPQAQQFLANANALGQQQSSDWEKNFTSAVANGLIDAQRLLDYQKLHPNIDVSSLPASVQASIDSGTYTVDIYPHVVQPLLGARLPI